jgi:hypothetical protein
VTAMPVGCDLVAAVAAPPDVLVMLLRVREPAVRVTQTMSMAPLVRYRLTAHRSFPTSGALPSVDGRLRTQLALPT